MIDVKLMFSFLKLALLMCLFLVLVVITGLLHNYRVHGIDLITTGDWSHVSGATAQSDGIHIFSLGREIIHQDGSAPQPNPPVNISGTHLGVNGDFSITARFSEINNRASLRLYSALPIVYDQWRFEPPSVEVAVDALDKTATVRIWDGTSSNSMDMRTFDVSVAHAAGISLQHVKNQIIVIQNNKTLAQMPDHGVFESGEIWFGADGNYVLTQLYAKALGAGHVGIIPPPTLVADQTDDSSLRELATSNGRNISIGAAISESLLFADEQYRDLALSQFSIWTPENSLKPQFVHPLPDVYDFVESDLLVATALKNNIAIHGHTLVYGKSSPDWMKKSAPAQRQQIMVDHIKNVVTHYKGSITQWDVVNEPFSSKQAAYKNGGTGLDQNIWFEAMGETYIDVAFEAAHQADPQAKLYLNDYALERDGAHWDAFLALVKRLKARGVPIDGVGFEAHVYADSDYFDAGQLAKHMDILRGLGLLVRISEIDVTGDDASQQVNQYVMALDVCLKALNCTSYATWGISDAYGSTTRSDRYPLVYGTSLLWGKDFKPKAALSAIQKRLRE